MRVALYARYSSDRQHERSIEDQLAVCRRHAEARGWTIVATFSDAAISGAAMANRPGLLTLLAAAAGGTFDIVLVEDEDRLARNLEHQAHVFNRLKALGVAIATLGSDKIGILEVGLKGVMAELFLANLGQKTSRGMRANAEKGLATGSRTYGYRSAPGGEVTIVEVEAAVVRRICTDYVAGATARDIATTLNREGVPGPRGGSWNASSISGSRQRGNGVLHNGLYAGVKVWNRMEVRRDTSTGKRLPVMKPESEWRRTSAEHLRVVPQPLWDQVRARKAADGGQSPHQLANARKPGIFTGLIKCGWCGASYTVYNEGRLICAGHRERGEAACGNRRRIKRQTIETRVLDGLRTRLLAPEAVSAYVRAYHATWAELARTRADRRRPIERRIAELHRIENRYCDEVEAGQATRKAYERAIAAEQERDRVEAELAAMDAQEDAPQAITLHPSAANRYAALVAQLQANLAAMSSDPRNADHRAVIEAVRALVVKIDVIPDSTDIGCDYAITLHGDLARFLEPAVDPGMGGRSHAVAGGGIEPPTCGL